MGLGSFTQGSDADGCLLQVYSLQYWLLLEQRIDLR